MNSNDHQYSNRSEAEVEVDIQEIEKNFDKYAELAQRMDVIITIEGRRALAMLRPDRFDGLEESARLANRGDTKSGQ